uniref:Uncharacterized protein n=6 Tax=Aegilops tauschii subsp. strangulata TaxID=200361 RepID=A0A453DBI0_AEGTS
GEPCACITRGVKGGRASRFPRRIWSTGATPTSNRPGRSTSHWRRKPGRDTKGALVGGSRPDMVDAKIITVELGYISYSEARVIPIQQHTALRCPSSIATLKKQLMAAVHPLPLQHILYFGKKY